MSCSESSAILFRFFALLLVIKSFIQSRIFSKGYNFVTGCILVTSLLQIWVVVCVLARV